MLTDDSGYGEQGRAALRDAFAIDEVKVVSDQVIPTRATDLAPQILAARRAGADRLIVWASAADVAATLEAVHKAGWNVPVISGQTGEDPLIRQRLVAHPDWLASLRFVSSRITAEVGPEAVQRVPRPLREGARQGQGRRQAGRPRRHPAAGLGDVPLRRAAAGRARRSPSRARSARRCCRRSTTAPRIIGANGDQRAYSAEYHEGVSPADMYFARFDGFVFVPVYDDPLSGTLPRVNQLG